MHYCIFSKEMSFIHIFDLFLGFGLFFEWSKSPTTDVTIHVSDSEEEDDPEDDGYGDDGNYKLLIGFISKLGGKSYLCLYIIISMFVPGYKRGHCEVFYHMVSSLQGFYIFKTSKQECIKY